MNYRLKISLLCLLLIFGKISITKAEGPLIEIFTNDLQPINQPEAFQQRIAKSQSRIRVYNFDDVGRFEVFLSKGLENIRDETKARALAKKRLFEEIGEDKLKAMAYRAYLPKMMALKYGITQFPAIVFNRSSVIYGVNDLQEAIQRWERWSAAEK